MAALCVSVWESYCRKWMQSEHITSEHNSHKWMKVGIMDKQEETLKDNHSNGYMFQLQIISKIM